ASTLGFTSRRTLTHACRTGLPPGDGFSQQRHRPTEHRAGGRFPRTARRAAATVQHRAARTSGSQNCPLPTL
nr:hypothetical protein [Tanacetum cinerariifolium]